MPLPLTARVNRLLEILFVEPQRSALARRLETEAAENIPFHQDSNADDMDRVRFAILKLVARGKNEENAAFKLAKSDWRDLFMAAGFGYDATEHDNWYHSLTKGEPGRK